MSSNPSPDLLGRVRLANAAYGLFVPGESVVVGVSGGPDSLALLHVLHALRAEWRLDLTVAHLNHKLRGDASDAEAAFVQETARLWGLRSRVGAVDVAREAVQNRMAVEEAGRVARYAFLAGIAAQVGAQTIAVAHNADDQVETILMHFLRGSGLAGLRGMLPRSPSPLTGRPGELREGEPMPPAFPPLTLVRPFLDVTRREIEAYCAAQGLEPRRDPSNDDTTLFRNRLRHEVLPYLEQINPNLRQVLRRASLSIADDYELIRTEVEQAFAQIVRPEGEALVFARRPWAALPPSLQRGTLREAVRLLRRNLRNLNWAHIEQARQVALEKETGARATLPLALELTVGYDEFTVAPSGYATAPADWPLLYADRLLLNVPGVTVMPALPWLVVVQELDTVPLPPSQKGATPVWEATLDRAALSGDLSLRTRRPGDRFAPSGMEGHTKAVHEFMIDEKIPLALRDRLPLLCDAEKIVWVCGWRVDARACVTPATRRPLRVRLVPHVYEDHRLRPAD